MSHVIYQFVINQVVCKLKHPLIYFKKWNDIEFFLRLKQDLQL